MANINQHHKGLNVTSLGAKHRRFAADFPGWDVPDHASYLLPITAGMTGVVTQVESHGIAPHTRYSVKFPDGSHASGLVLGQDISFARQ